MTELWVCTRRQYMLTSCEILADLGCFHKSYLLKPHLYLRFIDDIDDKNLLSTFLNNFHPTISLDLFTEQGYFLDITVKLTPCTLWVAMHTNLLSASIQNIPSNLSCISLQYNHICSDSNDSGGQLMGLSQPIYPTKLIDNSIKWQTDARKHLLKDRPQNRTTKHCWL